MHQTTAIDVTGQLLSAAIGSLRRWGSVAACSVALTSGVFAAEPVAEKLSPLDRLRERSAIQRLHDSREQYLSESQKAKTTVPVKESDGTENTTAGTSGEKGTETASVPVPLDMPLSEFDLGRTGTAEARPVRPAMVKAVPQPYFEPVSGPATPTQPITLPDFLEADSGLQPVVVEQTAQNTYLPPAPIAEVAQLPEADPTMGTIPGMVDTVFRPISQIQPYYAYSPTGKRPLEYLCPQPSSVPDNERARCPDLQPLPPSGTTSRDFAMLTYNWMPTDLKHKPLYFQDVSLERYGQQYPYGIQPFVSVGKFAVQGIGLPYQIAIDPIWRDIYPLGYYRPGDAAPELIYQVPFNLKAAAAAGGVYTGLIFLIP